MTTHIWDSQCRGPDHDLGHRTGRAQPSLWPKGVENTRPGKWITIKLAGGPDQLSLSRVYRIRRSREFYSRWRTYQGVILTWITKSRPLQESNQRETVAKRSTTSKTQMSTALVPLEGLDQITVHKRFMINPIQPWKRSMNLAVLEEVRPRWSTQVTTPPPSINPTALLFHRFLTPTRSRTRSRTLASQIKRNSNKWNLWSIRSNPTRRRLLIHYVAVPLDCLRALLRTHKICCRIKRSRQRRSSRQREAALQIDALSRPYKRRPSVPTRMAGLLPQVALQHPKQRVRR